jgi:DNA topoisomerase-1
MLAAAELAGLGAPRNMTEASRNVNKALDAVAERLGNTRAVCRKYYVHPGLVHAYLAGRTVALPSQAGPRLFRGRKRPAALRRDEAAVLQFLQEEALN